MTGALLNRLEREFSYQPLPGLRDEVVGDDRVIREPWRYIFEALTALGPEALAQRQQLAGRMLRDDGATYRIYDSDQPDSTWRLDLLPWVIHSEDWSTVEAGLVERSELFNLILQDLYRDRELITRGIVPPEVIFGHGGFLRACQGIALPGEHQLILHAADLVRRNDGSMCVLADRTQAPSGAGYALESRTVMNRVFPSLFRDSHVHRLSLFFQTLRQRLMDLMPGVAAPNMVVLSPGAYNEAYFEHAYLASYLGLSLVQSGDLTVGDGHVWMRSLDGLSRVDVILRRVDDWYCDPVELKGDSQLGISGLLEVARQGNVVIANPLGAGVLENPALLPYLPAIGRHFLGREPMLPSVTTWWGGDRDQLAYLMDNLEDLVVKSIYRAAGVRSVDVSTLDEAARRTLREKIAEHPGRYVGQERMTPSRLPVFEQQALQSRPAILRSFAVAADTSYHVMPGGLTRVGGDEHTALITGQGGSIGKDTWVLASEPERQVSLLAGPEREMTVHTEVVSVPSRVVENMFWLGRYAERAELGLRLMRTLFLLTNGDEAFPENARRLLVIAATRMTDSMASGAGQPDESPQLAEADLVQLVTDANRPSSVIRSIRSLLTCAEETKELMSTDTLRVVNEIRNQSRRLPVDLRQAILSAPDAALNPLISSLLSLSGIIHESMNRGTGWRFLDMGRRLERAMQTIAMTRTLLSEELADADQAAVLEALLVTIEALSFYRRRYRGQLDVHDVLELLLLDRGNPRSVIYQVRRLLRQLDDLPDSAGGEQQLAGEARHLFEASSMIRLADLAGLTRVDDDTRLRGNLDQLLGRLNELLAESSNALGNHYFAHGAGPQQLVSQSWEEI